jgi:hypothetical protein
MHFNQPHAYINAEDIHERLSSMHYDQPNADIDPADIHN